MKRQRALEPVDSPEVQPTRDSSVMDRPFQVGESLPRRMGVAEMCKAFAIDGHVMDRSTFHTHQRAGKFDRFELKPKVGARAWSGTLVQRYLDCEAMASRFVTVAGRKVG